jgi:hypothetical protein
MNHHLRALATALEHAESLRDLSFPRVATIVLRPALRSYSPAAECADRLVIRAATVFATIAVDDPAGQLAYARFADRASRAVYGLEDPLTVSAMTALAAVTVRQDLHDEAITVYGHLVQACTCRDEHADALTWRRDRATLLHDDGQCVRALEEIAACMDHAAGLSAAKSRTAARRALISRTAIVAGCGDTTTALALLRQHSDLLQADNSTDRGADEDSIAGMLHRLAATHPTVCTVTRNPEQPADHPLTFWKTAVHEAARR